MRSKMVWDAVERDATIFAHACRTEAIRLPVLFYFGFIVRPTLKQLILLFLLFDHSLCQVRPVFTIVTLVLHRVRRRYCTHNKIVFQCSPKRLMMKFVVISIAQYVELVYL